jgi:GTP-binding protein
MFVDHARIQVQGGRGGDGCLSFRREKFVPKGGPDGGDGGNGGSVIFETDPDVATLHSFRFRQHLRARKGEHGRGKNQHGARGEDLIVKVPVGTEVRDEEAQVLTDLARPGMRWVAARGGKGGRGNARFATSTNRAPTRHDPGEPGEERVLVLELRLLADVGLIGLPNAGKSTLISTISAARPKIADYPFTTLTPHLGVAQAGGYDTFVVADIPGLIEGAHLGAGLGARFLRHVERTRLLVHLVDVAADGRDPVADMKAIDRELREAEGDLHLKPQIVAGTKSDLIPGVPGAAEAVERLRAACRGSRRPFVLVSAATGDGIDALVKKIAAALKKMGPALPIEGDVHEEARGGRRGGAA